MNTTREGTSILDPSGLLQTSIDAAALEGLDFEPRCESGHHARGIYGHDPSASAAWLVVAPCCGRELQECDAWYRWVHDGESSYMECDDSAGGCWAASLISRWTFIPLADI